VSITPLSETRAELFVDVRYEFVVRGVYQASQILFTSVLSPSMREGLFQIRYAEIVGDTIYAEWQRHYGYGGDD
jgi:hypothetical protein